MSTDPAVLAGLFTNKGLAGKNALIWSETQNVYPSSTNGKIAAALFRVHNSTGSPITWSPSFYCSSYGPWGENASVAVNGANVWSTGANGLSSQTLNLTIPASGTSTVIFTSALGRAATAYTYERAGQLGFFNNSLELPAGLTFVDDLNGDPQVALLVSPSGFPFDIDLRGDGAGQLVQGRNNAFDGLNRLIVDGTPLVPAGAPTFADGGRTVVFPAQVLGGVSVGREVTVPNLGGYDFARTLDAFTNTTGSPLTVPVRLVGNLGSTAASPVFSTSDGDTLVETSDQWIGTDDADFSGAPSSIHYIHGPGSLKPTAVQVIGDNVVWDYSLTVPAGQTVRLAHFTIVGNSRSLVNSAAGALVNTDGFGGQAAAFLTAAELASIANFAFNDSPTANLDTATALEDGPAVAIDVLANDTDPEDDSLTIAAVTQGLHGSVAITDGGTTVAYTPTEADYFGIDSFTYTVTDSKGNSATATVNVTVQPVNDAPSFTPAGNVSVVQDSGPYAAAWATNLSAGPAYESGQWLGFLTAYTNPGLFSAAPELTTDGTLRFTPAPGAYGSAEMTVLLQDTAGTANGGVDTSAPVTFTIEVRDVLGPKVTDLRVRWGNRWESIGNVGRILPWEGLSAVELSFDEDVVVDAADAALTGVNVASYGLGQFTQITPRKVSWDLLTPVNIDRLLLAIDGDSAGALTDLSGNRLRGDGLTNGTDYVRTIRVLPGDINGDGVVNALDLTQVRNQQLGLIPVTIFGDMDGNGSVNLNDYNAVRRKLNTRLTV